MGYVTTEFIAFNDNQKVNKSILIYFLEIQKFENTKL